jgi:uncharacterized protein
LSSEPEANSRPGRRGRRSVGTQKWSRLIHVYTSMVCLLIVLFFSITGLTLNHPSWGAKTSVATTNGTMPANWKSGDTIDWLVVAEHLRSANDVTGLVSEHRSQSGEATIDFKGPGWKWVIDVIAIVLVVISLSGLLLQFFLQRRRRSAYITAGVGIVLTVVLMYLSVG